LGYWDIGILGYWDIGILGYWGYFAPLPSIFTENALFVDADRAFLVKILRGKNLFYTIIYHSLKISFYICKIFKP
jgi:hypothetical protein